tara:strand:- start:1207 stop:2112 length:906 start_codon:yes stop_codon:yes gene_type:complete
MPEPLTLIALALTAAGTVKANEDAKKDARARQRRQQQLFANQERFSKQTQEKLLSNLNKFSSVEEQNRRNNASETALESIQKVSKAASPIRKGQPNLGVAGKVSSAKSKLDKANLKREAGENAIRNQALANFLGISGGAVKTGRELSNLGQSLNTLRRDAKGQLGVDQARVAHSPTSNPLVANLLKAAGMAAGFGAAAGAGGATAGVNSTSLSAAEAGKIGADFGAEGLAQSGNWLGQTGGTAMQGFAPTTTAVSSSATPMFNFGPMGFSNSLGLAPSPQLGARWLQSAPSFDKFGNLIPR